MISTRLRLTCFVLIVIGLLAAPSLGRTTTAQESPGASLVYHQITNRTDETGLISFPVLAAAGDRGAFSTFLAGEGGPVYGMTTVSTVDAVSGESRVVDQYETLCNCDAMVDVSADGGTVVSSDSVQIRLAGVGELVSLTNNAIGAMRMTADGRRVVFTVSQDTSLRVGDESIARGVWAIDISGENLRQLVSANAVAEVITQPTEAVSFLYQSQLLDIADDGSEIVFGAYAFGLLDETHYAIAASGDGGNPHTLLGPVDFLDRVAISGDGATAAYDVSPAGTESGVTEREIGIVGTGGGATRPLLTTDQSSDDDDGLRLSPDGAHLLISPDGLLVDTTTGAPWQLSVRTPFAPDHWSVLTDGLRAATMSADGTRILYLMVSDDSRPIPQLATLEITPIDLGEAPLIAEPTVDPATITPDGETSATVMAMVETSETLLNVGLVALREGRYDSNVAFGAFLTDTGEHGDLEAGDGIFTTDEVGYGVRVERDDDTGSRMLRVQAEIETSDGLRHATAVEFGPLMVAAAT